MLTTIFYKIDEFYKLFLKSFEKNLLTAGKCLRRREFKLTVSEIMTISLYYHYSGYRTFKDYYTREVLVHLNSAFKNLVSYNRFLELRKQIIIPLIAFIKLNSMRNRSDISFIDSFPLKSCHIKRSSSHKTLEKSSKKGKTSVGWFYGFKLHLLINPIGEISGFCITPGNTADNNENVMLRITRGIMGKVFGDKGYMVNNELFGKLYDQGVQMVTKIRKNMKPRPMEDCDKQILSKRGIIESVGWVLKGSMSLEHTRHRSVGGFFAHIFSTLAAYCFRPKKPSIARKASIA